MAKGEEKARRRPCRSPVVRLALAAVAAVAGPALAGLLLASAASAGPARSSRAGDDDPKLVSRLFAALDVHAEIGAIAPIASAQLAGTAINESDVARLEQIVRQGFAPERLGRITLDAFLRRFQLERAREAVRFLERPEIRQLYVASRRPASACRGAPGGAAQEPLLTQRGAVTPRAQAIARIDATLGLEARARAHAERVFAIMLGAANRALPEPQRFTRVELAGMIAAHHASLAAAPAPPCRYHDVSTGTLREAARFLESDAGRWLYGAVSGSIDEALSRAARVTARRIVDDFEDAPPATPLLVARAAPGA